MTATVAEQIIREYLQDAIAAGEAFTKRLREFANEGDDQDVQLAFADHADESSLTSDRLKTRLAELGENPSRSQTSLAGFLELAPTIAQGGHAPEERLVQNLITAYGAEAGECARYQALAATAHAAGDSVTESLALDALAQEHRAAERVFHFLPTRSKIAFNVLTADEVDPAVSTKIGIV